MLPLTADELHEVLAQVGFALWQTQITESTVGIYLVLVHKTAPRQARSEVEAMFTKAGKSTLGKLLRAIQSTGAAPEDLVKSLDAFVPKRNWLVHHSRHENHRDMYSVSRRAALNSRLEAIADEALELAKAFQTHTEAHLQRLGVSREQIDRDAARILNEWTTAA
jgi:hypothetical protein